MELVFPNELIIQIASFIDNYEDLLQLFNLDNPSSYLFLINYKYSKYIHKNLYKYDTKLIYASLITVENTIKNREPGYMIVAWNLYKDHVKADINDYRWAETSLTQDERIYPLVKYMMLEKNY
jgi:hypothetical protein